MPLGKLGSLQFGRGWLIYGVGALGVAGVAGFAMLITWLSGAALLQWIAAGIGSGAVTAVTLAQMTQMLGAGDKSDDEDADTAEPGSRAKGLAEAAAQSDPAESPADIALEALPHPLVMFDSEDQLVYCNQAYADLLGGAGLRAGEAYETMVTAQLRDGSIEVADDAVDEWLAAHLEGRRHPPSTDACRIGGKSYRLSSYAGKDGGTVTVCEEAAVTESAPAVAAAAPASPAVEDAGRVGDLEAELKAREQTILDLKAQFEEARQAAEQSAKDRAAAVADLKRQKEAAAGPSTGGGGGTEILSALSDDLGAPINAIIGYADIIQSELYGEHADARYREYGDEITKNAQYMLERLATAGVPVGAAVEAPAPEPTPEPAQPAAAAAEPEPAAPSSEDLAKAVRSALSPEREDHHEIMARWNQDDSIPTGPLPKAQPADGADTMAQWNKESA